MNRRGRGGGGAARRDAPGLGRSEIGRRATARGPVFSSPSAAVVGVVQPAAHRSLASSLTTERVARGSSPTPPALESQQKKNQSNDQRLTGLRDSHPFCHGVVMGLR